MLYPKKSKLFIAAFILAVSAGVVYNSWPLGYLLNPAVSLSGGLASELEAIHQPFNWVFVALDVLCGALVILAAVMLWRRKMDVLHKTVIISFGLFGLLTVADALLPMTCEPSLTVCPPLIHQPLLILHGVASIGSAIFLFLSAALSWHRLRSQEGAVIMSLLMVGWMISGILTLYFFFKPGPGYLAQDYYLVLCGAWTAILPLMLARFVYEHAHVDAS